jgi:hypothetical protein
MRVTIVTTHHESSATCAIAVSSGDTCARRVARRADDVRETQIPQKWGSENSGGGSRPLNGVATVPGGTASPSFEDGKRYFTR